jgi:hypothetical protein
MVRWLGYYAGVDREREGGFPQAPTPSEPQMVTWGAMISPRPSGLVKHGLEDHRRGSVYRQEQPAMLDPNPRPSD